jgi:cytochrome c553
MIKFYKFFLFSVLICIVSISKAEEPSEGRLVAEGICAVCHGIDGIAGTAGSSALVPNLVAQNKLYLIEKLKAYKSGKLEHHQMSLIAQMLSSEDIKNVSEWYSKIEIEVKSEIEPLNY